ncbi:anhydro-N-acetylmuramic acid kinase [Paenibacillus arenilitoris]|uniref:Anhydro-N-acetylmuramic acid kinase n=1 Tax=Paenibacillus arenilitoris TaxID=2772299 RepID=A0A927H377_9BACL|nr:anhydro-N-acetylmuramic acid kinase [Paenibacillus arenilitoris]MBD2867031.1 anhydro-N-acetylmuramic acid kinase [Paenibacillus arenilitoris]
MDHASRSLRRYAVGLMSGTSADGIDAAVVAIEDGPGARLRAELIAFENRPYPAAVREELFALFDPRRATVDRVGRMNVLLGELYAEAALSVIAAAGLSRAGIAVVGSHGQTIWHAPETERAFGYDISFTVQIGEGAVIAARTGIPCVSDFRVADMAARGQGAPLVPFTEYLLYGERGRTLLLQNIGGIGNMTVLPAGGSADQVFAFDTGPGNMLIDGLASRLYPGLAMDKDGALARQGVANEALLEELRREPYYGLPLPKTTGRERFGAPYTDKLLAYGAEHGVSGVDLIASVTQLTAWSIGDAYRRYVRDRYAAEVLIVGGGGSYNPVLMDFLKREMEPLGVIVQTQEEVGGSSDAKEAVAFALLADYAIAGRPNNLPSVTGAGRPVVMGKISYSFRPPVGG